MSASAVVPIERVLSYTSYVRVGAARKRDVALTFDDGPGPYAPRILAVLRRMHAPATFFVIGEWARRYPPLVRAEARGGFELGDHTETHPVMSRLEGSLQRAQIVDAGEAIQRAGAPFPHLWRPPYGAFDAATLQVLRAVRMLVVLWTVDTSDYARPGPHRIWYTALSGARPGAIILMHDGGGERSRPSRRCRGSSRACAGAAFGSSRSRSSLPTTRPRATSHHHTRCRASANNASQALTVHHEVRDDHVRRHLDHTHRGGRPSGADSSAHMKTQSPRRRLFFR